MISRRERYVGERLSRGIAELNAIFRICAALIPRTGNQEKPFSGEIDWTTFAINLR
jgi:hypothetical protein